ncbi:janus kinase and microtubule-interacting protein [Pimephales promelas]|nr:janus kinase and microtubule-interacting protein [Pimephales promelas]
MSPLLIASLEQCETRLRSEVRDTLDQNELLEFRILELEVRECVRCPAHVYTHQSSHTL